MSGYVNSVTSTVFSSTQQSVNTLFRIANPQTLFSMVGGWQAKAFPKAPRTLSLSRRLAIVGFGLDKTDTSAHEDGDGLAVEGF